MIATSCAPPPELLVTIDDSAMAVWDETVASHPLPEEVVVIHESDERVPGLTVRSTTGPLSSEGRVLAAQWLAPTRAIWERPGVGAEGEPVPLESIGLPRVAEAVDGRYADHSAYPLVDQVVVTLDLSVTDAFDPELILQIEQWYEGLPDHRERPEVQWIGGVGDMMLQRGVTRLLDREDGLDVVFGDVLPELRRVDLMLGNLEGAVTTRGTAWAKTFTFRFHPRVLPSLEAAGFDYLSVVNNHSYDYGAIGFADTLAYLAQSPIATSGVGQTPEEAAAASVLELGAAEARVLSVGAYPVERSGFDGARDTAVNENRAGVLWAEGRNPAAKAFALEAMRDAFGPDTLDIVMVHGGAEWATAPSEPQRRLYREYVDAGADIVFGHHSHVTQGIEAYDGALIVFSLGNFVFPGMFLTEYGEESKLVRVGIADGEIRYLEMLPVRIDHQTISLDQDSGALDRIYAASERLAAE